VGKSASSFLLILLLATVSFTFLNIPAVWAEPFTIYIRPDGSIDPPTANITTLDNFTYTFTDNNMGGIMVESDNIVLDGASYVLRGFQNNSWKYADPDDTIVGVNLNGRNNVTVQNLIVLNVPHGIGLYGATDCIVRANLISTEGGLWPSDESVTLSGSNNTIIENTFDGWIGVNLEGSNNSILRNQFNTGFAIWVQSIVQSINNVIAENNFVGNQILQVDMGDSTNTFYHNNFHFCNLMTVPWIETNWNETYPVGGNYWSDYNGTDEYSGPYQNETGSDGIGDTPYVLAENQTDNYPLMGPWTVTGENILVEYSTGARINLQEVTAAGMTTFNAQSGANPPQGSRPVGSGCNISTKAEYSGNVEVSLPYDPANMTQQEEKAFKITQWNEITLTWTNITANVDTQHKEVTGQTTHLSLFAVMWRLGGDVNGDFTVDIFDAILLSNAFNSVPSSKTWNGNADMNNDNIIGPLRRHNPLSKLPKNRLTHAL
jgi:hypothetical protein